MFRNSVPLDLLTNPVKYIHQSYRDGDLQYLLGHLVSKDTNTHGYVYTLLSGLYFYSVPLAPSLAVWSDTQCVLLSISVVCSPAVHLQWHTGTHRIKPNSLLQTHRAWVFTSDRVPTLSVKNVWDGKEACSAELASGWNVLPFDLLWWEKNKKIISRTWIHYVRQSHYVMLLSRTAFIRRLCFSFPDSWKVVSAK